MTDEQFNDIMSELAVIRYQTKPKSSAASISGFQGGTVVKQPPQKVYQGLLDQYGGIEKLAVLIRQRKPGYPETSEGIVGKWDGNEDVAAFMKDFPGFF